MSDLPQTYLSPRWTEEVADCSFPVTFDTYSRCSFGCLYCFSVYQKSLHRGGAAKNLYEKPLECVNIERVKRIFRGEVPEFKAWVENKRPIQWGGLADQFDLYEKKYGKTLELLEFFDSINYPISFSTKSTWPFHDERYLRLFRNQGKNWHVKFSIITENAEIAAKVERGVPSPQERLEAMRIVSDCGCYTTLRLRPYIIGISDRGLDSLIRCAAEAGAYSVSTEALCVELRAVMQPGSIAERNFAKLSEAAGIDLVEYYRTHSICGGYLRLNPDVKRPIFERIHRLCDRYGLRFFCSDACGKAESANGCCCGAPPSFAFSRGNFSAALQIAKKRGFVKFSDIEQDMQHLAAVMYTGADGLNTGSGRNRAKFKEFSLRDYLRYLWNDTKRGQSPARMFADYLEACGIDENGDIVYRRKL